MPTYHVVSESWTDPPTSNAAGRGLVWRASSNPAVPAGLCHGASPDADATLCGLPTDGMMEHGYIDFVGGLWKMSRHVTVSEACMSIAKANDAND
jgi:hypothetical protein